MNARQREVFNTLNRILTFVENARTNAPLRTAPPGLATQIQRLRSAVAEADAHSTMKISGDAYRRTVQRSQLRRVLRDEHLWPIRNMAKVMQLTTPGLPKIINLPRRFGSEQALVSAAKATLRDATPFQKLFVENGLPSDFLTQLQTAIVAVELAGIEYGEARTEKVAGQAGITAALHTGLRARQAIATIIKRCCLADPVAGPSVRGAWNSVSHIHRSSKTKPVGDKPVMQGQIPEKAEHPVVASELAA